MTTQIKIISGILFFLFLLIFASLHVEVPYFISTQGILLPEKEWKLTKSPNGTILNLLKDNRTNSTPFFTSTEFSRGDHAEFHLNHLLKPNSRLNKGDTIGFITSHQESYKLLDLEKELNELKQSRQINLTGEKPERTKAAMEELRMAETNLEAEKIIFDRNKKLHDLDVIADQEFEQSLNFYNQKKQEVLIANANYEDLTAGSKQEEIEYYNTSIDAILKQINVTQKRLDALTLTSPVSGFLSHEFKTETNDNEVLARVISTENMVLMVPVEISQIHYLKKGLAIKISNTLLPEEIEGKVIHIDSKAESLNGRQAVFVTCLIKNEDQKLLPNLKVKGNIICKSIPAFNYFQRLLSIIFNS